MKPNPCGHWLVPLWLAAGLLSPWLAVHGAEYTLTRDGAPAAVIIHEKPPTRAAYFAALELREHIRKITGVTLPLQTADQDAPAHCVKIHVGETERAQQADLVYDKFKDQEYAIQFGDHEILLVGRDQPDRDATVRNLSLEPTAFQAWPGVWDEQGTMYAVYDFLERFCGVRWFNATELGTVIPETRTLVINGGNIRHTPFFLYRDGSFNFTTPGGYDESVSLWPFTSEGFKRWENTAYPELHKKFANPNEYVTLAKAGAMRLFLRRMRTGGRKCFANHSLWAYYDRFWEKSSANPSFFCERRPEFFAQGYEGKPPQLCYTNPDLVQRVAQDARDYFDGKAIWCNTFLAHDRRFAWGEDVYAVEPMDNDLFCKCANCRKWMNPKEETNPFYSNGRHSNYFFQFVNAVAREVAKTHPGKRIITLAYLSHAVPPEKVRLEPNVRIMFCFANNRLRYDRPSYEQEVKLLNAWAGRYPDRPLSLWLYNTFPVEAAGGNWNCFPGYFAHTIGEQFRLFHKLGLKGVFHCGYGQEVESHVTFKLMDDPTRDVDALIDDYFNRYYGAAGPAMKQLYGAIEAIYCNPGNYPPKPFEPSAHQHQTEEIAWGFLGTEPRMRKLRQLWDEAQAAAKTPMEKQRLELFNRFTWSYLEAGRKKYQETGRAQDALPPTRTVPFTTENYAGDPTRADWREGAALPHWRQASGDGSVRNVDARILHDGKFLYLRLREQGQDLLLKAGAEVGRGDCFRILIARQRQAPYRELLVAPDGKYLAREIGSSASESALWESQAKVISNSKSGEGWTVSIALPIERLVAGGALPDNTFFLNLMRQAPGSDDEPVWCPTHGPFENPQPTGQLQLDGNATPSEVPSIEQMEKLQKDGLVAWWRFEESRGQTVRDSSGNKLDGQIVGPVQRTKGVLGKALCFTGEPGPQYVEIGNAPLLNLTAQLSLEAWVKYQEYRCHSAFTPALIGKGYANGMYSLHIRGGNRPASGFLWFELDGPNEQRAFHQPAEAVLSPGDWDHVAATWDGARMRIFLNGREVGKSLARSVTIQQTEHPLRIGLFDGCSQFTGCIDEAAIYNRALSPGEIYVKFKAGLVALKGESSPRKSR